MVRLAKDGGHVQQPHDSQDVLLQILRAAGYALIIARLRLLPGGRQQQNLLEAQGSDQELAG